MVLLCRSLLNFLKTFASLIRSSFFEFGKILPHPRGIRPSFFAPGQGIRQKNFPGWPGLARSKNFPWELPWGGDVPSCQLELIETLPLRQRRFKSHFSFYDAVFIGGRRLKEEIRQVMCQSNPSVNIPSLGKFSKIVKLLFPGGGLPWDPLFLYVLHCFTIFKTSIINLSTEYLQICRENIDLSMKNM